METSEEFIREKIREKNSFPKNYVMEALNRYTVTGEDCLRWAHEFAEQSNQDKPLLGLAKTSELIYELSARCDTGSIDKGGDYRPVDN